MYHLPIFALMFENVRRLREGYAHPTPGKGVNGFHTRHPSKLAICMDRDFARLDVHTMCVSERY